MNSTNVSVPLAFQVIAIRPHQNCDKKYLRLIKPGIMYYFYNNFSIDEISDKITIQKSLPEAFFQPVVKEETSPKTTLPISISAIVGKNGSGKSSLIELLFRTINNAAIHMLNSEVTENLAELKALRADLYFYTDGFYKLSIDDSGVWVWPYNKNGTKRKKAEKLNAKSFFYSIAINFSHYAYNTEELDDEQNWLDGLFHKNDGYQTPLVISPLRTQGNIDMRVENTLVKSRIMVNFLSRNRKGEYSFRNISVNQFAYSVKLTLKQSKRTKILYTLNPKNSDPKKNITIESFESQQEKVFEALDKIYFFGYDKLDKVKYKVVLDYVLYKLCSICLKYKEYNQYFLREEAKFEEPVDIFLKELFSDESHITFKIRQTLNFLKYKHISFLEEQTLTLDELAEAVDTLRRRKRISRLDAIFFVPPPIFSIDIQLRTKEAPYIISSFTKLSSGERQLIYSASTIFYHLYNVSSVRASKNKVSYRYVNIILEEVELYFHPEMQQNYCQYLIDSISGFNLRNIKGINICFVTHSPFLLSDIPNECVLFLNQKGCPETEAVKFKTFGANIHSLLAHSFFLSNGAIGEFARQKIQNLIKILNETKLIDRKEKQRVFNTILLIGEPILKDKLLEMYYASFEKEKRIKELELEIKKLKND